MIHTALYEARSKDSSEVVVLQGGEEQIRRICQSTAFHPSLAQFRSAARRHVMGCEVLTLWFGHVHHVRASARDPWHCIVLGADVDKDSYNRRHAWRCLYRISLAEYQSINSVSWQEARLQVIQTTPSNSDMIMPRWGSRKNEAWVWSGSDN